MPTTYIPTESQTLYDNTFVIRVLDNTMSEQSEVLHSVVVYFRFAAADDAPLHAIGAALTQALADAGAGTYDGHEVALLENDDAYLFLTGPDAERLYEAARPVMEGSVLLKGAQVTLRHGPPDDESAAERRVELA